MRGIDANYGPLNADRFNIGKRLFVMPLLVVGSFTGSFFITTAVGQNGVLPQRTLSNATVTYNLLPALKRTGSSRVIDTLMPPHALALVAITLGAAIVNGALGYGFSSITVPLALLFLSNRVLNPALVLIEVPLNAYVLWVNRDALCERLAARAADGHRPASRASSSARCWCRASARTG